MWWILGTIIGTAWNLHEERDHPELKAKREEDARIGFRFLLTLVVLFVLATISIMLAASVALR